VAATAMFGVHDGYALGVGAVDEISANSDGGLVYEAVLQVDLLTVRNAAPQMANSAKIVVPVTIGLALRF
jgi:hypothetical protein